MCLIGYPDIAHFRAYSDIKFFNQENTSAKNEANFAADYEKDMALAEHLLDSLLLERMDRFKKIKETVSKSQFF